MLPESYVQQYITDCIVYPTLDFDSDHHILITHINTPTTRKARWKPRSKKIDKTSPDLKSLELDDVQKQFQSEVGNFIQNNIKISSVSTNYASERLIEN